MTFDPKVIEVIKPGPVVNEGLVEALEEQLKLAKSGKIQGVITIISFGDGNTTHEWSLNTEIEAKLALAEMAIAVTDLATYTSLERGTSSIYEYGEDI